jgi:hypothetical protein
MDRHGGRPRPDRHREPNDLRLELVDDPAEDGLGGPERSPLIAAPGKMKPPTRAGAALWMMSGFGVALFEEFDVEGDNGRQVLLITGGAGNVAGLLRPRLARKDRTLRLLDIAAVDDLGPGEEVVTASITDADAVARACAGASAVLHLGALSNEAPWADILAVNVDGTRTVLEAARGAGVHRVILASSNHAAGFHTRDEAPVAAEAPPRPDTYYGFSKAAIEALGSLYASRYELNVACLRIGTCFAYGHWPRGSRPTTPPV